ncbi:hypothetical protein P153DRAFT_200427 [Dothidotthia symphoricarpi CBS 119687]|uniref:Uncharacterized protein n=1 Tax=Dothidotthia symphoricarpi CBS 119687 TaxID=1392245 RepID=A0A6A6AK94_9PLEO|nr:uncharacterized protein P153DRAFT_200427 [Dothidotthia symphoricarpi CBS 119687]KAF2131653.1 hypothetical protein P153DRAFT_200427 [Dothidotthia symphoricarpi CBS 119687]
MYWPSHPRLPNEIETPTGPQQQGSPSFPAPSTPQVGTNQADRLRLPLWTRLAVTGMEPSSTLIPRRRFLCYAPTDLSVLAIAPQHTCSSVTRSIAHWPCVWANFPATIDAFDCLFPIRATYLLNVQHGALPLVNTFPKLGHPSHPPAQRFAEGERDGIIVILRRALSSSDLWIYQSTRPTHETESTDQALLISEHNGSHDHTSRNSAEAEHICFQKHSWASSKVLAPRTHSCGYLYPIENLSASDMQDHPICVRLSL